MIIYIGWKKRIFKIFVLNTNTKIYLIYLNLQKSKFK